MSRPRTPAKAKPSKLPDGVRLALEDQQQRLSRVQGIVGCAGKALEDYFGGRWPPNLPLAALALEAADVMIGEVLFALDDVELARTGQRMMEIGAEKAQPEKEQQDD